MQCRRPGQQGFWKFQKKGANREAKGKILHRDCLPTRVRRNFKEFVEKERKWKMQKSPKICPNEPLFA